MEKEKQISMNFHFMPSNIFFLFASTPETKLFHEKVTASTSHTSNGWTTSAEGHFLPLSGRFQCFDLSPSWFARKRRRVRYTYKYCIVNGRKRKKEWGKVILFFVAQGTGNWEYGRRFLFERVPLCNQKWSWRWKNNFAVSVCMSYVCEDGGNHHIVLRICVVLATGSHSGVLRINMIAFFFCVLAEYFDIIIVKPTLSKEDG